MPRRSVTRLRLWTIDYFDVADDKSITLKYPLSCRRNLLSVLKLVLLQPATCDLCQSFVPKLVPALFQAKSSDCTPECTKGSRSANGIQQLAPDLLDVLCSRESLHD